MSFLNLTVNQTERKVLESSWGRVISTKSVWQQGDKSVWNYSQSYFHTISHLITWTNYRISADVSYLAPTFLVLMV